MHSDELKTKLFSQLARELKEEGATELNTEVLEANEMPRSPGIFAKLLRKIGGRFVTLVGKFGGLGYILYVTWVQAVPQQTAIYVPLNGKPVFTNTPNSDNSISLPQFDPSGSAELWISSYGPNRLVPAPTATETYVPCSGDKILYLKSGSNPYPNCFKTVTGSFAG